MNWYYIAYIRYNTAYHGAKWEGWERYYQSMGSYNTQLPDNYDLGNIIKGLEDAEQNIQIKYVITAISKL